MEAPAPPGHRPAFGILDALTLLVLVGVAAVLAAPRDGARRRAGEEVRAADLLLRVGEAAARRGVGADGGFLPYPDLDALLAGEETLAPAFESVPDGPADVRAAGPYYWTVLLPDGDGVPGPSATSTPEQRRRGFVVVAWPRRGDASGLRSLAGLPGGVLWQRGGEGGGGSGLPDRPPTVHIAFPERKTALPAVPPIPREWEVMKGASRKGPDR